MSKLVVTGGKPLSGTISISGNKNSVLPCIAASLLTEDKVTLTNVPHISDVDVLVDILRSLGADVEYGDHKITVEAKNISIRDLPQEFTEKLRASVLLVGPMLSRFKKVNFFHPGGDIIGKRSIEAHLEGFKKLGFDIKQVDREYQITKSERKLEPTIFLDEASVTATENLLLASVIGNQTITIKNCAKEPHVVDLCNLLNKMGAKIEGTGDSTLTISGVEKLNGVEFRIGQDFMEMATYSIAATITGGAVTLENCQLEDMEPVIYPLIKMGIQFREDGTKVHVSASHLKAITKLNTNIWPGFPTDLMSIVIVLATQSHGASLMHDWMYESRMFFVDKLINMGAEITVADPHRVLVYGPSQLYGRDMESPDIRAGMALLLAALVAEGESIIKKAELIDRGYEDVVTKLTSLGANIRRED